MDVMQCTAVHAVPHIASNFARASLYELFLGTCAMMSGNSQPEEMLVHLCVDNPLEYVVSV